MSGGLDGRLSELYCVLQSCTVISMGACRIFFRGGQIRASGDESPPAESRVGTPVWVWG